MRRATVLTVVTVVLVALVPAAGSAGAASDVQTITRDGVNLMHQRVPRSTTPTQGTGLTRSDFDGDGIDDVAASALPIHYTGLPHIPTSIVIVRYSSAPVVDYFIGVYSGGGCACLGESLAAGDFNADGYDDLAIGDQAEKVPTTSTEAGGIWIIPGGAAGLRVDVIQHFTQDTPNIPGAGEQGDIFGAALAAGDINGDGRDDLAVGAPGESIGTSANAGAVTVIFGGGLDGLTTAGAVSLYQDLSAVPGGGEPGDMFGGSLAIGRVNGDQYADLVLGAPLENSQSGQGPDGSGAVTLMWGSAAGVSMTGATAVIGSAVTQTAKIFGTYLYLLGTQLAVTDTNGDGLGEVIAGSPAAEVAWGINVGAVVSFVGRSTGLSTAGVRVISQETAGVAGTPEDDDRFGHSMAVGDVTGDGRGDVLVGIPGEDIGSAVDAGAFAVLPGSASGLTGSGSLTIDQGSPGVPGASESGDSFGYAVELLNLNGTGPFDAVIGSTGEEVTGGTPGYPAGAIVTFYASSGQLAVAATWSGVELQTEHFEVIRYSDHVAGPSSSLW